MSLQQDIQMYLFLSDEATTKYAKGKVLEDLICTLFLSVPGISMLKRNKKNVFSSEEIDILLWNECYVSGFPSPAFPPHILIECKNWTRKVGSSDVSWFDTKLKRRGLNFGILVATQGVTGNISQMTEAYAIISQALTEQRKIIVITWNDIQRLTNGQDVVLLIREKICQLILTESSFD